VKDKEYERLKDPCLHPPGGWVWRDPETTKVVVGGHFRALVDMAIRSRNFNKIDIPQGFEHIIEHDICRRLSDRFVTNRTSKLDKEILSRHQVDTKTDTLLRAWVKAGRRLVTHEKSKERSAICQHCTRNAKLGCLSCKGIDRYLLNWLGHNRRTGYEDLLGGCDVTGCYAMVMVHLKLDDIPLVGGTPDICWRKKELMEAADERHE